MLSTRAKWLLSLCLLALFVGVVAPVVFAWANVRKLLSDEVTRDFIALSFNLFALVGTGAALGIAYYQIIPLRRSIDKIAAEQRRMRALSRRLVPPRHRRELRGFDARFTSRDWRRFLETYMGEPNIDVRLNSNYREFYSWLDCDDKCFAKGVS